MTAGPPYGTPEPGAPLPAGAEPGEAALRRLALRRLKQKQAFRTHLFSFVVVNGMLWIIWLVTSVGGGSWFPWPIFPTLGWGIGLAFNWRAVYGPGSRVISESEIDAEVRRLRGS